ncbi:helix-turn-helix transcriptional regulator [Amycolatopsis sp. 195334CR]|uniref:helix-turn-helix domain-containing protein n=1 Tax=Amycolatopsis sp. 195334CR TaxID=2814588 RepID=UPI001A8F1B10|nr:helix-turn-helix transcriptional regulator [Amycolatopsis sp. 195334CR]MBN6035943.1 helix-turn-helix transcriptional regulator [Amycolatopsis sp. 195334CR]
MSGVSVDPDFDQPFREVLGEHLRRLRRARKLSREQVCARLHNDMSIGTLGSYESGARRLTVSRLVELCEVLGTTAHEVLADVHRDLRKVGPRIRVRLKVITRARNPELRPLRAWAEAKVALLPPGPDPEIELDEPALREAATLCGLSPVELLCLLQEKRG